MAQEKIYVGVDICKEKLDIAIFGSERRWCLKNSTDGIREAIGIFKRLTSAFVVFEATGGIELPLWEALTNADIEGTPINPRQIRDFARAKGILAKTDTIDAALIAHYGKAMQPKSKTFPDTQELKELIARRSQLVEMISAEKSRLKAARKQCIREDIKTTIEWLEGRLGNIDRDLKHTIKSNPAWRNKEELLRSTPGVGPTLSATLLAQLPELGTLSRHQVATLAGVAPLNRDSGMMQGKRAVWEAVRELGAHFTWLRW